MIYQIFISFVFNSMESFPNAFALSAMFNSTYMYREGYYNRTPRGGSRIWPWAAWTLSTGGGVENHWKCLFPVFINNIIHTS